MNSNVYTNQFPKVCYLNGYLQTKLPEDKMSQMKFLIALMYMLIQRPRDHNAELKIYLSK